MGRIHRYQGETIVVEFELERCIHTGDCTAALPAVFDTRRTGRWVNPDAADAEQVVRTCAACPTGALRARDRKTGELLHPVPPHNAIQVIARGPLYVHGRMHINGERPPAFRVALCRCGASQHMPYCDGGHRASRFDDDGHITAAMADQTPAAGELDIETVPDGPLRVMGPFLLIDGEGHAVAHLQRATFCRCGASRTKPFCDGSHARIGWQERGTA